MKIGFTGLLLLILVGCTLSASQEKKLNYQLGLYLNALENKSVMNIVAFNYPSYVKYVKSKGNDYFKSTFSVGDEEEDIVFTDPKIEAMDSEGDWIEVLYAVDKEYILHGESKRSTHRFVAVTNDDGEHWFFLNYSVYRNKNICKDVKRLLN